MKKIIVQILNEDVRADEIFDIISDALDIAEYNEDEDFEITIQE